MTRRVGYAVTVLLLLPAIAAPRGQSRPRLDIPEGRAVHVDIPVDAGWTVAVDIRHDTDTLFLVFSQLRHGAMERYPELLIDPANVGGDRWSPGQWWLHSSYNLCEGDGAFNVYERDQVFQCAKTKAGWASNHFPLTGDGRMTITVALSKFRPALRRDRRFGFALDVTDTKASWTFWPAHATMARPASWGQAALVGPR